MATWSDKQLRAHKRAQGYVSATGATLGIAALGAAGAKTGVARSGAVKLARLSNRVNPKAGAKVVRAQRKVGGSVQGLTVGSAGVGGVGGYNFAAISSQESKRRNVGKAASTALVLRPLQRAVAATGKTPRAANKVTHYTNRKRAITAGAGASAVTGGVGFGAGQIHKALPPGMTRAAMARAGSIAVKPKVKRIATAFPQGGAPRKPIVTSGGAKTMVLSPLENKPRPITSAPAAQSSRGLSRGAKVAIGGSALAGAGGVGYAAGRRSKVGKSVWGVDHGHALDADRKM